jgi:hypothetical protein
MGFCCSSNSNQAVVPDGKWNAHSTAPTSSHSPPSLATDPDPDPLQSIDALLKHLHDVRPVSVTELSALKESLFQEGWLHLSSKDMVAALKYFGATTKDLCRVADPTSSPHSDLWFHETLLPWKRTQASRYMLRKKKTGTLSSPSSSSSFHADFDTFEGCDSKSVVRYEVNKEQVDFGEYWKEANSKVRTWEPLADWYGSEKNSVYMAYQKLSHFLIETSMDPSPGCVAGDDIYVSDHFNIRITKTPEDGENAQPSPEGVHHDGSDIIMITLMNRKNVEKESGQSRVWHKTHPSGPYSEDSFDNIKEKCLKSFAMIQPYETLLAVDSKVKHEARAIKPLIKDMECSRDVTVHWTRTPRLSGCDTIGRDSDAKNWISEKGKSLLKYDNASHPTLNFWRNFDGFFGNQQVEPHGREAFQDDPIESS